LFGYVLPDDITAMENIEDILSIHFFVG